MVTLSMTYQLCAQHTSHGLLPASPVQQQMLISMSRAFSQHAVLPWPSTWFACTWYRARGPAAPLDVCWCSSVLAQQGPEQRTGAGGLTRPAGRQMTPFMCSRSSAGERMVWGGCSLWPCASQHSRLLTVDAVTRWLGAAPSRLPVWLCWLHRFLLCLLCEILRRPRMQQQRLLAKSGQLSAPAQRAFG
jgi:hypothetical protein